MLKIKSGWLNRHHV